MTRELGLTEFDKTSAANEDVLAVSEERIRDVGVVALAPLSGAPSNEVRPDRPLLLSFDPSGEVDAESFHAIQELLEDDDISSTLLLAIKNEKIPRADFNGLVSHSDIGESLSSALESLLKQHQVEFIEETEAEDLPPDTLNKPSKLGTSEILDKAKARGVLSKERVVELAHRIQEGDIQARQTLVEHNYLLVAKFIGPYLNKGLEYDDLFMEGVIGLNRAAEKFDPTRETMFSTYAIYWIEQAFQRALEKHATTIRLPWHVRENKRKLFKHKMFMQETMGIDNPTLEQVAGDINIEMSRAKDASEAAYVGNSLHELIEGDKEPDELGTLIENENAEDPVAETMQNEQQAALEGALSILTEDERAVVTMHYGLNGSYPMTLYKISLALKLKKGEPDALLESAYKKMKLSPNLRNIVVDGDFEKDDFSEARAFNGQLTLKLPLGTITLEDRQVDAMRYLAKGLTYPQVAQAMGISTGSAKHIIQEQVYTKLKERGYMGKPAIEALMADGHLGKLFGEK